MGDDDPLIPPTEGVGKQAAKAALRGLTGAVPYVGPPLSEALATIINAPLQRRIHDWREEVMRRIQALEERLEGFSEASLLANENFASAVIEAQMAIMRSNAKEKHEALANAVLNVALDRGPDDDRLQMFMAYIADLTPWHLRLLSLFNDPAGVSQRVGVNMSNISLGGISTLVERVYPELRGHKDFYTQLANDLTYKGLLDGVEFGVTMTGQGMVAKRTTNAGDEFIRFVSAPPELTEADAG